MSDRARAVGSRIINRGRKAGVEVVPPLAAALARYVSLLAQWNARINLTGLLVEQPNEEAIDRLIVEPLAASRHMNSTTRVLVDLGSGGGSPAIPIHLAHPQLRLVMVESKVRKCAFLREAVRELVLTNSEVENRRFEELLVRPDLQAAADIVTVRAVRLDAPVLRVAQSLIAAGGEIWLFRRQGTLADSGLPATLRIGAVHPLLPSLGSELVILESL